MDNVTYISKQDWALNEIVNPQDVNKWEKGIADVVALANYLNTTEIPDLKLLLTNLQNNVANKDLSNITQSAAQRLIPVGALIPGPVTELDGFLLCNGQTVSRTEYAALYAKIGTSFGSGDGSTTFNVPDYRGCFLRGFGGDSAADMYTKQPMAAPNITGTVGRTFASSNSGAFYDAELSPTAQGGSGGGMLHGFDASRSNSAYGAANEIRPVNFAVNFFIKY